MSGNQLIALLGPTIGAIFTAFLIPLWLSNRSRPYIIYFVGTFAFYTLATGSQFFVVPDDTKAFVPLPAICFLICAALLGEGCLKRQGRSLNYPLTGLIGIATLIGVLYYFYVERNLGTRIFITSTGCGLLLATAAYRLRPSRSDPFISKFLFWILVVVSLQVLLRPLAIASLGSMTGPAEDFQESFFLLSLHFSLVISAVVTGLTLFAVIVLEVATDLRRQSTVDVLTGTYNRRGFYDEALWHLESEGSRPLSLVLCDIDHFKSINDTYGHLKGDQVIRELAKLLTTHAGPNGIVGRIGGEEFAMLLPQSPLRDARSVSENVRSLFEVFGRTSLRGTPSTSASFGIASYRPGESLQELMSRADSYLYTAKRSGRNRICAEDDAFDYRASA